MPWGGFANSGGTSIFMGKYKPAGSRKAEAKKSNARAIPCLVIIVAGMALVSLLFYELLKSGS